MEPTKNSVSPETTIQSQPAKWYTPLTKVTTTSKILAAITMITLPFVGGYVGYKMAPDQITKVVMVNSHNDKIAIPIEDLVTTDEVELPRSLLATAEGLTEYECTSDVNPYPHVCFSYKSNTAPEIKNLTDEAKAQGIIEGRTALGELIYVATDSNKIYFTAGIPESDGCCRLIAFATDTQKFNTVEYYRGLGNSFSSNERRYIATVENDTSLYILDLETETVIQRKSISNGSLMSSKCGFAGAVYDVKYNEIKNGFDFGIYSADTISTDECIQQKISEDFIAIPK